MVERQLVFEDFSDKIGGVFAISEQGLPAIPLILKEAEPLKPAMAPPGIRPPFSLLFLCKDPRVLSQRIYRIEHDELGVLAIFVVPIGRDAEGVSYQAIFN